MSENFEKMTVLELRRVAKEMGVKLGAGISKQGIVDKLNEAAAGRAEAQDTPAAPEAPAPQPEQVRPVRSASIIVDDEPEDDEDDVPVLTAHTSLQPQSRPAPRPQAPSGGASSLSSISSKAPAFTMEGSRAWHNPRAYQSPAQPYTPRPQNWGGRPAQGAAPDPRGYNRPPQQRPDPRVQPRTPSYPNRFGPDTGAGEERSAGEYRPQPPAYAAQPQDYQPRNDYPPRDYQPRNDYAPRPEYSQPKEAPAFARPAVSYYPPKEGTAGQQPAMPEMMAAGECGDGEGVLEVHPDGYGFLRADRYHPGKKDVYVANAQIRRFNLRSGDYIAGKTRPQREGDRYSALLYITEINGKAAEENPNRLSFDDFTAIYPKRRIMLSGKDQDAALRLIDLLSPIGLGQRALIEAGPKTGKTLLMKKLAKAIHDNHPKAHLMVVLVDERPEDVTEMRESIKGEVIDSTFDEPAECHVKVCELALERAQRLVEMKKDVVILVDNLTRLARAYNALSAQSVRTLEGGLAAGAMNKPKKFFGAARNTREGGSLTVIAAMLSDPGNALDQAILQEMQGTANMEMQLLRNPKEKRLAPVMRLSSMRTRHDELLLSQEERNAAARIRALAAEDEAEALTQALSWLAETENNAQLAEKWAADEV